MFPSTRRNHCSAATSNDFCNKIGQYRPWVLGKSRSLTSIFRCYSVSETGRDPFLAGSISDQLGETIASRRLQGGTDMAKKRDAGLKVPKLRRDKALSRRDFFKQGAAAGAGAAVLSGPGKAL